MKKIEVHYRKTFDGGINILDIKNVADKSTIVEKFGEEVARAYFATPPWFSRKNGKLELQDSEDAYYYLDVNDAVSSKYFQKMVEAMMAAGHRLREIVKFYERSEIKKILI